MPDNDALSVPARPTIGVLIDDLENRYEISILSGIAQTAREHGVNLLCVTGGTLDSPYGFDAQRNVLYEWIDAHTFVDGWVFVAGTLAGYTPAEQLLSFYERYKPRPRASLTMTLPGVPSVLVDNVPGMRQLLHHLIEDHGYRRIGFICGPAGDPDAETRYQVYMDVLAAHGLPFDPALVAQGDFTVETGIDAIRLFLDERRVEIQAIAAANDMMALGAIDALQMRGLQLPEQMAVVGFDDLETARAITPPLTTVRQPLHMQARQALEAVLAQLRGETVAEQVFLPAEVVIRRSCGCSHEAAQLLTEPGPARQAPFGAAGAAQRHEILAEMKQAARLATNTIAPEKVQRLLEEFIAEIEGEVTGGTFSSNLEQALQPVLLGIDVTAWQELLSILQRRVLPHASMNPAMAARAGRLWQDARVVIGETAQRVQGDERFRSEFQMREMSRIMRELNASIDLPGLTTVLGEGLPGLLKIERCYLALYETADTPIQWARLVLAYDRDRHFPLEPGGRRFPVKEIVPPELLPGDERYAFVVEPLYFQDKQLGYILFDLSLFERNPNEGFVYEELREQISSALRGILLYQQIIEREQELQVRTAELAQTNTQLGEAHLHQERAYQSLQANQEKLLIAEKLASLGRLTAGIAHEMNTPVAAVRAVLKEMENLVDEYWRSLDNAEVTPDDHHAIADDMRNSVRLAATAIEKAEGFVHSIQAQSRDLHAQARQRFNAVTVVREALVPLGRSLREHHCEASFETSQDEIELSGSPARLAQLISNLVLNAIEASTPRGGGPITIRLSGDTAGVTLEVSDLGRGIPENNRAKIFDPMFTTKPFGEGAGMGLTIVHDILQADFSGTIEVTSREGAGSSFRLHFPSQPGLKSD